MDGPLPSEYYLEDCIQMTHFVPPPNDRKKKDKDEEGGDGDVRKPLYHVTGITLRRPVASPQACGL